MHTTNRYRKRKKSGLQVNVITIFVLIVFQIKTYEKDYNKNNKEASRSMV